MNPLEAFQVALQVAQNNPELAARLTREISQLQQGIHAVEQTELQFQLDRAALLERSPHLAQAASELDLACEQAYWDGLNS